MSLTLRPMSASELSALTALFDYNDIPAMIAENSRLIDSGDFSIYLLFEDGDLIGELHVTWRSEDPLASIDGQRAYLSQPTASGRTGRDGDWGSISCAV